MIRRATLTGNGFTASRFAYDDETRLFVLDWTTDGRPVWSAPYDTVDAYFQTHPDMSYVPDPLPNGAA